MLVGTPIGNLGDLSDRAREVLRDAAVICCEDTRRTRALLSAMELNASPKRLWAVHDHNEAAQVAAVCNLVAAGQLVAVVTDAGTPGVADPGSRLVGAAHDRGLNVSIVPGPSAAIDALVVSGQPTERFVFEGFLPRKGRARAVRIASLLHEERTSILFESPNRTAETLGDLAAALGDWRSATVVRELTKVHETITRAPLGDLARRFAATEVKGEVVLVIGPGTPAELDTDAVDEALLAGLQRGERMKDVARSVATAFQVDQRATYDRALELRESSPGS